MSESGLIIAVLAILLAFFVVLVERKFLAYAHRRMGPAIMGRNGAFQIVLDLVKMLTKEIFIVPRPSTILAPMFLALLYSIQLLFSQNFIFGPSMFLFENIDAMILHHLILVLFSNIFFVILGLLSQSRYSLIGTVRAFIHTISLDIFITVIYSLLIYSAQSANFHDFVLSQNLYWFFFLYAPTAAGFLIVLLLEAKRTPFDQTETESEVVSGYQVEYSGPMLLIFYLAEYMHLVISAVHFTLFFFGGWACLKLFWFLPPIFLIPHEVNYWYDIFTTVIRV